MGENDSKQSDTLRYTTRKTYPFSDQNGVWGSNPSPPPLPSGTETWNFNKQKLLKTSNVFFCSQQCLKTRILNTVKNPRIRI